MSGSITVRRRARRGARVRAGRALVVAVASACLLLAAAVAAAGASAAGKTDGWTRVVARGLTDPNNTYAPFSARFNDHLYLSTIASPATVMYSGSDKVGGEIWRTADGIKWERVGRPGLGDRGNVSFALVVFRDRLYAVSTNTEAGLQIWVSSDGLRFTRLDIGALSDKHDSGANPFVFRDRPILGVTSSVDGAQIWVSDDGVSLKPVVGGGMGDRDNNGIQVWGDPQAPGPVFRDELYAGVSNSTTGGRSGARQTVCSGSGRPTRVSDEGRSRSSSPRSSFRTSSTACASSPARSTTSVASTSIARVTAPRGRRS